MEQLLAKLTNLGYEFFGIILPGIIALVFLVMWWVSMGQLAPVLSSNFFPHLTSNNASLIIESISVKTGIGIALPSLIITYFLGHILQWTARSGGASEKNVKSAFQRTIRSLIFRIPKYENSHDLNLTPLFNAVQEKFSHDKTPLTWGQFFPLAKSYLARNFSQSLVSNYQNKYTLHRSVALASACLFWMCLAGIAAGVIAIHYGYASPRWWILFFLGGFSLVSVWGFSGSYAYNWRLFGNSIVTETYSLIFGPDNDQSKP
ncbi:hypothetical protein NU688_12005 [Variovorax sp. ZS18.2.2]|uniref:hypothetical protein n=1 Tax=Variovorax sp. ZS18.2.2 TaxID=2971255 RepID=UPI0021515430|nr:hypothetical protein [Variovorax sp. ZS18.2.2]MCR6476874.1 hypothetical protein [Variovorax sp. ZS18.2.2]